jgi:hypothetical protein
VHSEGSKQCIVPGYAKSKVKGLLYKRFSNRPGNARRLENEIKRLVASVREKRCAAPQSEAPRVNLEDQDNNETESPIHEDGVIKLTSNAYQLPNYAMAVNRSRALVGSGVTISKKGFFLLSSLQSYC